MLSVSGFDTTKFPDIVVDNYQLGNFSLSERASLSIDKVLVSAFSLQTLKSCYLVSLNSSPSHRYMKMKDLPHGKCPIMSTGNGDCLFNSVGIALFGTEDVAPILRLGSIQAAMQHVDHFVGDVSSKDSKVSI